MEKEEILNSGILESYVLGIATPDEESQVEMFKTEFPEIENEIATIRLSLETFALQFEKEPPIALKEQVLSSLKALENENINTHNETPFKEKNIIIFKPYAMAASYILLALSIGVNFYFYAKWKNTQSQLADISYKNQELAQNFKASQKDYQGLVLDINMLQNPETKTVMLKGMKVSPTSWVKLYWNKNKKMVLLASKDLPKAPEGMVYQVWAIMDGKPVDAGMLEGNNGMQKLKEIEDANAFAITLEKKGGKPQPEGEMYVMGKVNA